MAKNPTILQSRMAKSPSLFSDEKKGKIRCKNKIKRNSNQHEMSYEV